MSGLLKEDGDAILLETGDALLLEGGGAPLPAGQYYTNFSEYTSGVIPSDWTARWVTSGVTWSVQEVTGSTGGKVLRGVRGSTGRSICTWNEIDADADRATVEILVRMRCTTKPPNQSIGGVVGRGSATGSQTGYVGNPVYNATEESVGLTEYASGTFAQIATLAKAWTANDWYWARFQANGTALKIKRWSGAVGDEPGTWDIETTDSSISAAGWVGAFLFSAVTVEYDVFGVGTGGQSAPSSASGPTTITPDPVSITFSVPTPTVRATVKPEPVVFTFSAVTPTVRATVKPNPVAITFSVPTPTLPGQSITVTPDPVAFTFSIPTPRVLATVKPSPVSMVFGVTSPSIRAVVKPSPVSITFSVPTPTIGGAASYTQADIGWTSLGHKSRRLEWTA